MRPTLRSAGMRGKQRGRQKWNPGVPSLFLGLEIYPIPINRSFAQILEVLDSSEWLEIGFVSSGSRNNAMMDGKVEIANVGDR